MKYKLVTKQHYNEEYVVRAQTDDLRDSGFLREHAFWLSQPVILRVFNEEGLEVNLDSYSNAFGAVIETQIDDKLARLKAAWGKR
mgnify:CR=1 FL=1